MRVPAYEYYFHKTIVKIHTFITGKTFVDSGDPEGIINPYSGDLRDMLSTLAGVEEKAIHRVAEYEMALNDASHLVSTELDIMRATRDEKEISTDDAFKISARIEFYLGLENLLSDYLSRTEEYLDSMQQESIKTKEVLTKMTERYANKTQNRAGIQE